MTTTVSEAVEAFRLFSTVCGKRIRLSLRINEHSERQLLHLVRIFLLGYFGESLVPEYASGVSRLAREAWSAEVLGAVLGPRV